MGRRWLITGATGLLAGYVVPAAAMRGHVVTTSRRGGDIACDLSAPSTVEAMIQEVKPDVVVHTAGLTDVDRCEREPDLALAANRDAAGNLAAALPASARLIAISTDQVYPDAHGPHAEDNTGPVNQYGRSKLAGEDAALAHPRALVLRTNFFGPSRNPGRASLSDFIIGSLEQRKNVTLFSDVSFSPLHMQTAAELIAELAETDLHGVYNLGSRDGMSKADFALAVAAHRELPTDTASIGSSETIASRAPRPHDLRMDVTRISGALGRAMPVLKDEIRKL